MIAGVLIAAFLIFLNKQTLGKFVKKLFDERAESEATAKSLSDLGFAKNRIVKLALKPGSTLRKVVRATEEKEGEPARYYIPEETSYRAEVTYNPDGSSVMTLVIAVIVFLAAGVILMTVIPDLIQMAGNAIEAF